MSARGFTLLEVVVVLVVLGIAASAAVPAYRRLPSDDPVEASAREVLAVLRSARRMALERSTAVTLVVEPSTGRFWVATAADDSLRRDSLALAPGVRLTGDSPRVRFAFARDGTAQGGVLALLGHGRQVPVLVDRWSGDVRAGLR